LNSAKDKALDVLKSSIVINASESVYPNVPGMMFSREFLEKLSRIGMTAVAVTCGWKPEHDFRTALDRIISTYSILGGGEMLYGETVQDIYRAKEERKLAVILQFQNTIPIEHDVRLLEVWYKLGVRIVELTYNERNLVGDGCMEKADCGLSEFGRKVVEEMNRIGLVIDLSHVGERSASEAIELSKDPLIFSHSNARAVCDVPRNISDEHIKAVAEKRGVIGINALSPFLRKDGEKQGTTLTDYLKHIDHVVKLVGVDFVGIGTDYTEGEGPPRFCFRSITDLLDVAALLLENGYSDKDLKKIMGENWLRVFKAVWKEL